MRRECRWILYVATWNIQSLVEVYGGDRRICRSCLQPRNSGMVDRKLDLVVNVMSRIGYQLLLFKRRNGLVMMFGRPKDILFYTLVVLYQVFHVMVVYRMRVLAFYWMLRPRRHGKKLVKFGIL